MNHRCLGQVAVQAHILPDDSEDLESGRTKFFEALGRQQLDLQQSHVHEDSAVVSS